MPGTPLPTPPPSMPGTPRSSPPPSAPNSPQMLARTPTFNFSPRDLEEIELSDSISPVPEASSPEPVSKSAALRVPRIDLEEIELSDSEPALSPTASEKLRRGSAVFTFSPPLSPRSDQGDGVESVSSARGLGRQQTVIGEQAATRKKNLWSAMDLLRDLVTQGASPPGNMEIFLSVAQTILFLIHLVGRVSLGLPSLVNHEAHINDPDYTITFTTVALPGSVEQLPQSVMAWAPEANAQRLNFTVFFWVFFGFLTLGTWVFLILRQVVMRCGALCFGSENDEQKRHHEELQQALAKEQKKPVPTPPPAECTSRNEFSSADQPQPSNN
eukprot:TRINITY_DN6092_c0_g1_i7.p1 TRINITY_DN6092_c0_g1~~TRINITY_DN6092_c0_g1_i7.p1  ORF type:complete len:328 (+),score=75.45 TRINITY_DN6092_c0_g1_i7:309-1292(+)